MAFSAEAKITWKWVTGETVDYDNWDTTGNEGVHPKAKNELYAEIAHDFEGQWQNHEGKNHGRPGAYESKEAPNDKTLKWIQWKQSDGGNDHWYAISMKKLTWKKHDAAASDMGAYLATITKVEEQNFINELRRTAKSYDTFIGLYGTKENDTKEKEKETEPTGPRFVRENYTGRVLGVPPPINSTASTNSPQSGGSYSRISLRNRTRIN